MTRDLIVVDESMPLSDVANLFLEKNISGAPVAKGRQFVGEISKTDLLKIANVGDLKDLTEDGIKKLKKIKVKDVVKKPICIFESSTVKNAAKKMDRLKIKRLLVLDKNKKLVGIITRTDLKKGVSKEKISNKIGTTIDEMLRIVESRGSVNIQTVSELLKVPITLVEEWAKVLEENELITIEYKTIGKPVLRLAKPKSL
jgi:CBS domain-containing protein